MELYQLKTFVTVAQTSSVTRAAEKLNTTPPSVSNHIRQLETEFNMALFTRTSKGMFITSQGDELLVQAKGILDSADRMSATASKLKKDIIGSVALGINADPLFLKVSEIIDVVYKDFPGIQLEIVTSSTGEIIADVGNDRMTCGYAFGKVKGNGVVSVFLRHVNLLIALPTALCAENKDAPLKKLADLPWIVPKKYCPFLELVQSTLQKQDVELGNTVFANDDITKIALVNRGEAVCVLEENEAIPFVSSGVITPWQGEETFTSPLSFVYAESRRNDLPVRTILSIVTKIWQ